MESPKLFIKFFFSDQTLLAYHNVTGKDNSLNLKNFIEITL